MARRTPALCHTSIPDPPAVNRGSTLDVQPFPVRTLLAQRTRCCRVENWNPEEPSHKLQRMKVECMGEDGVESTWEVSPRPNRGGNRWRRGFIYSQTPSSRCSSSWGRTWLERWRWQDQVAAL